MSALSLLPPPTRLQTPLAAPSRIRRHFFAPPPPPLYTSLSTSSRILPHIFTPSPPPLYASFPTSSSILRRSPMPSPISLPIRHRPRPQTRKARTKRRAAVAVISATPALQSVSSQIQCSHIPSRTRKATSSDSAGIQTLDLQNRNLTLYSAKLRSHS